MLQSLMPSLYLHVFAALSVVLREVNKLRILEKVGAKSNVWTHESGNGRRLGKLRKQEIYNLYCSLNRSLQV
jgi:hypothetical protein